MTACTWLYVIAASNNNNNNNNNNEFDFVQIITFKNSILLWYMV